MALSLPGIGYVRSPTEIASSTNAGANRYAADQALLGQLRQAQMGLQGQQYASDNQLAASRYGADAGIKQAQLGLQGQQYASDNQLKAALEAVGGNRYAADQGTEQARIGADAARYGADRQFGAATYGADRRLDEARLALEGSMYGSDQRLKEAQRAAAASEFGSTQDRMASDFAARMGLQGVQSAQSGETRRARELIDFQQEKFNALMGHFDSLYRDELGPIGADQGGPVAGPDFGMPTSIYGPGEVDAEVNAARAQNEQRAAGEMARAREQLAGRGMGGSSPLLSALSAQIQGRAMGANADAERQIRLGAREANTGQASLAAQQAADTFASRQQEDIQRRGISANQRNALLAALAGLA